MFRHWGDILRNLYNQEYKANTLV